MNRSDIISQLITDTFAVTYFSNQNESKFHQVSAESHFKIILVSEDFNDISTINRHRKINNLLAQEFANGLHALSLHLFTPDEWAKNQRTLTSPACKNSD